MKKEYITMKFRTWMILLLSCIFIPNIKAGIPVDTLQARLTVLSKENPVIHLYVHLDRNNYMPEDTIWFKAYVFSSIANDVLYVRLTDKNKNIVLEKQFPVYDVRAHGDILIPDTLPEGKYYFYAYTDKMISLNPGNVFVQPITVNKIIANRLEAEASVTNLKKVHRGDNVEIRTRVKGAADKMLKGKYSLWVGQQLFKKGSLSTNNRGEDFIRFKYPQIDNQEMVRCEIRFEQDKEFAELVLNLRHEGNTAIVKAFAEGGHFLEGLTNHTVFEVTDDNNNPLEVSMELLENKKAIATMHTDKQGLCSARFIPRRNVTYTLAVHENDTVALLPFPGQIETEGYGLRINTLNGRTSAVLTNRSNHDSIALVLNTPDKVLWSQSLSLPNGDSVHIDLPDQDYTKSILNVAVFDSLTTPKAERLYLNKKEDPYKVQINTSKTITGDHASVKVNLNIVDANNQPVAANLSVSIVEKSALNRSTYRTILQSYYFREMAGFGSFVSDERTSSIDDRLIGLKFAQKNWENVLKYQPKGRIRLLKNTGGINGYVTYGDNKPVKLEKMMLESTISIEKKEWTSAMKKGEGDTLQQHSNGIGRLLNDIKDNSEFVNVNDDGSFYISPKSLLVNSNETKQLLPGDNYSPNYNISLTDYAKEMDDFVRNGEALNFTQPVNVFARNESPVIRKFSKEVQLKEFMVESRSKFHLSNDNMGKKDDYVCREFNVFNCMNHRSGGYKAEAGRIYARKDLEDLFLYNGPGKPFSPAPAGAVAGSIQYILIKNISKPNNFYNPEATDTLYFKTDTRTTLYWSPNIYVDATGKTTITCNTSNRNGDFTITVQGLEVKTRQPIYGTFDFKL